MLEETQPIVLWVLAVDLIVMFAYFVLLKLNHAKSSSLITFLLASTTWLAALHIIIDNGTWFSADISGGKFFLIILFWVGLSFVFLNFLTGPVKDSVDLHHIQIVQGLRVFVGAGFLMEGTIQLLPPWFAIMDGFLHVTSGFAALIAALTHVKNHKQKWEIHFVANMIGTLDVLIIATTICFVVWNTLGPFHNMMYVVFYAAPIVLWLHFISFRRLLKTREP